MLGRRYALLEQIGAGGYSEVWRGTDMVLARPVAIKGLHLGCAEAQHAGALSHENIARVYDYGEPAPPQPPFLVMELVAGPSLAGALASGPLDPGRSLDIVAQTASGLHAAHLAGLVHRDIKPGNLLLAPGGLVKISDFGIAYAADSAPVTGTGQLLGTPGYLAPERTMGTPATAASDLYALGVVAYECLAGAPPFTGPALAVALAHRERPLPPLPGWVPADVAALVRELTAKDPADRPRSAGEVARRASQMAGRPFTGATAGAGAPPGDPAFTVAEQVTGYPAVAPGPATAPTQDLAVPPMPAHRHARGRYAVPGSWWRRLTARPGQAALPAAGVALLIAAAFLIGSLIQDGPAPHAGTAGPGSARVTTVEVKPGPLIGQPVSVAAQRLRQPDGPHRLAAERRAAPRHGAVGVASGPAPGGQPGDAHGGAQAGAGREAG